MLKIEDINKYIEDSILDTIFRNRQEELYKENKKEDLEIIKIKEEYTVDYERLLIAIKNLSPYFQNTREGIIEALENYLIRENLIVAHDNEKFYKARFLWWY